MLCVNEKLSETEELKTILYKQSDILDCYVKKCNEIMEDIKKSQNEMQELVIDLNHKANLIKEYKYGKVRQLNIDTDKDLKELKEKGII